MEIRLAELNDADCIAELSNQLGYKTTGAQMKTRLSEIFDKTDHCVYVAVDSENSIGWIHCFFSLRVESDSFVEIGGLVVDEKYRRKGVGKILVKKATEWARAKGCSKIRVRCNTLRHETHVFYTSMGFAETKEQKIFDLKWNQ